MKKTLVCILASLMVVSCTFGKIRNGYSNNLDDCRKSLHALQEILAPGENLSPAQRRTVKAKIQSLTDFISYHDVTEQLIAQLLTVSPDLYYNMDNLKDKKGRLTDIYVKLIPREKAVVSLMGVSFFSQDETDGDAHNSGYGQRSVSIEIWIGPDALQLLYHELGHTNYIVPNIADYSGFYRQHYVGHDIKPSFIGHHPQDGSGKMAQAFEARYRKDYALHLKNGGSPLDSMQFLMMKWRKDEHL